MVAGYWHKKEQRPLSADDQALLTALEGNIAAALTGFGAGSEGVFAKLSSRSPKDSQFSMDRGVNTVIEKLEAVKAASGIEAVDDNAVAVSDAWLAACAACAALPCLWMLWRLAVDRQDSLTQTPLGVVSAGCDHGGDHRVPEARERPGGDALLPQLGPHLH